MHIFNFKQQRHELVVIFVFFFFIFRCYFRNSNILIVRFCSIWLATERKKMFLFWYLLNKLFGFSWNEHQTRISTISHGIENFDQIYFDSGTFFPRTEFSFGICFKAKLVSKEINKCLCRCHRLRVRVMVENSEIHFRWKNFNFQN